MKLLLVLGANDVLSIISRNVKPLGFDIIRYSQVLKAMDNIDEIDPDAIIISARDFPRHWKTMVQFVRNERAKNSCPIVILQDKKFPTEEVAKASFLGVSGIITEALNTQEEIEKLQGILCRYASHEDKRKSQRFFTVPSQRFNFIFARPDDKALVTGEVKNISLGGIAFLPGNPALVEDLLTDQRVEEFSLRAGDSILSPSCRVARTGQIISFEFVSFPDGESEILQAYIETLPKKEKKQTSEKVY